MQVLPFKSICTEEQALFGTANYNLSKLARAGLPVMEGLAITPLSVVVNTILTQKADKRQEIFEQSLTLIKKEILRIPLPEELKKELVGKKLYFLNGQFINSSQKVWERLVNSWLEELRASIWQEGFDKNIAHLLTAQAVYFPHQQFHLVKAHFDPELEEVILKSSDEYPLRLSPVILKEIAEIVRESDRKLFIPQVYKFAVFRDKVNIVGMNPFTQILPLSQTPEVFLPPKQQKKLRKSAVKILLNLSQGLSNISDSDGVYIEGKPAGDFESEVFKICDAGLLMINRPIIYMLPNSQPAPLDQATRLLLFLRNKKGLNNLEIALPIVHSDDELAHLKRELSVRGITRKGSLKFWVQMSVPENIINFDDYFNVGIDGIIINLDLLQSLVGGYPVKSEAYYRKEVKAMTILLKPFFKRCHQLKLPVMVLGEVILHPEMTDFLVEAGVWGVVSNTPAEQQTLPDYLSWSEDRLVQKRASNLDSPSD